MTLLLARPHVLSGCRGIKETSSILRIQMRRDNSTSQHSAQRRAEAIEENVTAALTRRTLHRGRLRLDDEVMSGSRRAPTAASRARAKRRSR